MCRALQEVLGSRTWWVSQCTWLARLCEILTSTVLASKDVRPAQEAVMQQLESLQAEAEAAYAAQLVSSPGQLAMVQVLFDSVLDRLGKQPGPPDLRWPTRGNANPYEYRFVAYNAAQVQR
jgi:hypothetical protein